MDPIAWDISKHVGDGNPTDEPDDPETDPSNGLGKKTPVQRVPFSTSKTVAW